MTSSIRTLLLSVSIASLAQAAKTETFVVPFAASPTVSGNVVAIVPDAYTGTKPMPVLMLLHGASNDEKTWSELGGNLGTLADRYGRIILCPSAGPFSWYNPHNGSEQYIMDKVLPAARTRYKMTADIWIAGSSMGGYGTLRLFADHPKIFTAAIALSPGTKPSRWQGKFGIDAAFGPEMADGSQDMFTDDWLKKLSGDTRPLLMVCGDRDFFLADFNASLASAQKAGHRVISRVTPGTHGWPYWSVELPIALETLAKTKAR